MTHSTLGDRARAAYGVDPAGAFPLVVKTTRTRRGLQHAVVFDPQEDETGTNFPQVCNRILADAEAGKAVIAAGLPVHASLTRWLKTPFPSISKARRVLPSLLDIQLPFPLERCVYRFLGIRRTDEHQVEALSVAARTEDVEQSLARWAEWNLDPDSLDHEGLALWAQGTEEVPVEADAPRAVVYLGEDRSAFAIGLGDRLLSTHGGRAGYRGLLAEATGDASGRTEVARQQFVRRAHQVLRNHFAGANTRPVQWIWTGPGAEQAVNLTRELEAMLGQDPFRFLKTPAPASFLARALSARALREGPLRVNFREQGFEHPRAVRDDHRQRVTAAVAVLVAGLVLCSLAVGWRELMKYRGTSAQASLRALAAELAPNTRLQYGQEVSAVARAIEDGAEKAKPFGEAFQPSLSALLGGILDATAKSRLHLNAVSLREQYISMRGASDDYNLSEALESELLALGFDVSLERQDAGADELVHFALQGNRAP